MGCKRMGHGALGRGIGGIGGKPWDSNANRHTAKHRNANRHQNRIGDNYRGTVMANDFDIGDLVKLDAKFVDEDGALTDPTATTFSIKVPAGTVTTYTYGVTADIVRDSTGLFHLDYSPTAEGIHYYRFVGTGACQTAEEKPFYIRPLRTV